MIAPEPLAPCASCGRRLPAEDLVFTATGLVCEPCQAEGAKAELRRDSIDAAWKAVEATLPTGWYLACLAFMGANSGNCPRDAGSWWEAQVAAVGEEEDFAECAYGPTPAAALRALAAKLAEES